MLTAVSNSLRAKIRNVFPSFGVVSFPFISLSSPSSHWKLMLCFRFLFAGKNGLSTATRTEFTRVTCTINGRQSICVANGLTGNFNGKKLCICIPRRRPRCQSIRTNGTGEILECQKTRPIQFIKVFVWHFLRSDCTLNASRAYRNAIERTV